MNKVLYLHVGWSKTGTSAIQSQAQKQRTDLMAEGILYPQSLQWPDHSHHPFALSFKGDKGGGGYNVEMSAAEALDILNNEWHESGASSVFISSELSPIYFNNQKFCQFVKNNFDSVKLIFTVRLQSELLMSLMNQLIKDPNVRYRGSLFHLAMQNLEHLSYLKKIQLWEKFVGKENIHCIAYSRRIVQDFLAFFSVDLIDSSDDIVINKSVPNRVLPLIQSLDTNLTNEEYLQSSEGLIQATEVAADACYRQIELFSVSEQKAFDKYFEAMNIKLSTEYMSSEFPFKNEYATVNALANM